MAGHLHEFDEANALIDGALRCLPQDSFEHMQAAIAALFCTASLLAGRLPPAVRKTWAHYAYRIADNLAAPDQENRHA